MIDILEKIVTKKSDTIKKYKNLFTINDLKKKISVNNNYFNFEKKLSEKKISVIAEIKKASPSAGVIVKNYDPNEIAKQYYIDGASCLSILTEENFFYGKMEHIEQVKKDVNLPVLCKDFFIDPYQIYLAKAFGADAILIILSIVNMQTAMALQLLALSLNMSVIVEVHSSEEAKLALKYEKCLIGINNRNLKTLKTDFNNTFALNQILKNHTQPLICESGIKNEKDVQEILKKTKINNFLIGESLLKDLDKNSSLLKRITQIIA